jgi:mRNA-degrading endonuclease YafQ of YafQ-DinJ toxin-antitoxin module
MRPTEFINENKVYKALSMAFRIADLHNQKVVKVPNGFIVVKHSDPRPQLIPNPYRADIEPKLRSELEKIKKQKQEFLKLKAKVDAGFLYGKEYEELVSEEKWKEIKLNLKELNKQLKFLPKKYNEIAAIERNILEEISQAIKENNWSLLEDSFGVEVLTCPLFHESLEKMNPKIKDRLKNFIEFKKQSPTSPFNKSDGTLSGISVSQYHGMGLRHTHLTHDLSLVYSIEGKDPIKIKLFGVFSHDQLGTGQPPRTNVQSRMATKFAGQPFDKLTEESQDTLGGSFTPDLIDSKMWLCQKLAKLLKGRSAGRIYALGSWYGNIGIFLQQAGINFDDLVLVETDTKLLDKSAELLQPLYDEGRLLLLHQDAKDVVYEKPATVINCSTNDMDTNWLTNVPKNVLIVMQGRNNVDDVPIRIPTLEKFDDLFPLRKVLFLGEIALTDPEIKYQRYMKIGFN